MALTLEINSQKPSPLKYFWVAQGEKSAMSAVDQIDAKRERLAAELVETVEVMRAWRADLAARIARARLRFEALGIGREEIIELAEEWRDYQVTAAYLRGQFE
jgi:hypothetical protein